MIRKYLFESELILQCLLALNHVVLSFTRFKYDIFLFNKYVIPSQKICKFPIFSLHRFLQRKEMCVFAESERRLHTECNHGHRHLRSGSHVPGRPVTTITICRDPTGG